eukprot:NODE_170_length_1904_cov_305.005408.p1 GENE.NODE_170_length_1904_cov_305.005408~~NODE_170_length_1904_cov_305.005408.p1  ORF type:complete len:573 (+),score=177.92 NODE_170_length_1904_cov_305.005408:3-1721(+)
MGAPDGVFPLAEEEVAHHGTVQRYKCFQRGPNSLARFTMPEMWATPYTFLDKQFLFYEGERWTYGQALNAASALSRELHHTYKLGRGAVMSIASQNCPEWIIALIAATGFLGSVALPTNSWWSSEELRYGLEDSRTAFFAADLPRLERTVGFIDDLKLLGCLCLRAAESAPPCGAVRFEDAVAAGAKLPPLYAPAVGPDDLAMLMYTSGTTALPKAVMMTHRTVATAVNIYRAENHEEEIPLNTVLVPVPLFHVTATHSILLAGIHRADKFVLMRKWDVLRAMELIQEERVVVMVGVPTMTHDIIKHPDVSKYDLSSIRGMGGGGAAFAPSMVPLLPKRIPGGFPLTGYGLTETNAVTCSIGKERYLHFPKAAGHVHIGVEVCTIDENLRHLAVGEVGEICIRGANIMQGYWHKPDKTKDAFHFDEAGRLWFRSGDIGRVDEHSLVYITDRAKDVIIRGGENISCGEVEAAFLTHPAIREVAACGFPDERLGETVAAALIFHDKAAASPPSFDELRKHVASSLAAFKIPEVMFLWPEASLPVGATGKILKRDIRARLVQDLGGAGVGKVSKL